jgi:Fic family protein
VSVARPPSTEQLFDRPKRLRRLAGVALAPGRKRQRGYPHWDDLRRLEPPSDLGLKDWWFTIKLARAPLLRRFPLTDSKGRNFVYSTPDDVLRLLHRVDETCRGGVGMQAIVATTDQVSRGYLVGSLMEEALRSGQLDGATTPRREGLELLRSGRKPADRSEQLILDTYRALLFTRETGQTGLTPTLLLELNGILTEGTVDDPSAAGRFRKRGNEQIGALCDVANGQDDGDGFMHPVVRAILLHFWIAQDRPFAAGNGRTARVLFYWSLRRQSYPLAEYLSISRILRTASVQYARSFRLAETDDRDATYFLLHQLQVMERAITEFQEYLARKTREIGEVEALLADPNGFNHRQLELLSAALRNPQRAFTFHAHARGHEVTHETARNDLLALEARGLLDRSKIGRRFAFVPPPDVAERLGAL